jgi:hypothetical protein
MWRVVIEKVPNKIFFVFLLAFLMPELQAGFLQSSTILNHKSYDIAIALPFSKNSDSFNPVDSYSGGLGIRTGWGLYNFMDLNFSLAKWGNLKPVTDLQIRLGFPKDTIAIRPSMSFGVGYGKFSAGYGVTYQTTVNTDNLMFPLSMMFSGDIKTEAVSFEPYFGLNLLINKYNSLSFRGQPFPVGFSKGDSDYLYFIRAGIILSPACLKITKLVLETQLSLDDRARFILGDTYVIGIIVLIQALGNTDYLSF